MSSEINSLLGRQRLAAAAATPQNRVLTVPDGEMQEKTPDAHDSRDAREYQERYAHPAQPQEFRGTTQAEAESYRQARADRLATDKKISSSARERVEVLIGLGRVKTEVELEGVKFTLQSLKAAEMRDVTFEGNKGRDEMDKYFLSRNHTVARSIVAIDGQPVDLVLGSRDQESVLDLINNMEDSMIETLHDTYFEMVKLNKRKLTIESKGEAKEVVEDVKK